MLGFDEDRFQNQLDIYQAQLDGQQEKLEEIEGVKTPECAAMREEIAQNIYDIQVNIERTNEQCEQEKEQEENQRDIGFFHD